MRAALIESPGSPAVGGERPEPTRGEGEVLVAVSAAPIVPLDRLCASGTSYFGVPSTPYVPHRSSPPGLPTSRRTWSLACSSCSSPFPRRALPTG